MYVSAGRINRKVDLIFTVLMFSHALLRKWIFTTLGIMNIKFSSHFTTPSHHRPIEQWMLSSVISPSWLSPCSSALNSPHQSLFQWSTLPEWFQSIELQPSTSPSNEWSKIDSFRWSWTSFGTIFPDFSTLTTKNDSSCSAFISISISIKITTINQFWSEIINIAYFAACWRWSVYHFSIVVSWL